MTSLKNNIEVSLHIEPHIKTVLEVLFLGLEAHGKEVYPVKFYTLCDQVGKEGWTAISFKNLEQCVSPHIGITRPFGKQKALPELNEECSMGILNEICNMELYFSFEFLSDSNKPEVLDEDLVRVISILQDNIVKTDELIKWVDGLYIQEWELYGKERMPSDDTIVQILYWYVELLERLSDIKPDKARAFILLWPETESDIFEKLRIYFLNNPSLYSNEDVLVELLNFSSDRFWHVGFRKELFYLLSYRLNDFELHAKDEIIELLLIPRRQLSSESEAIYQDQKYDRSVEAFYWLKKNGVDFDISLENSILEYKNKLFYWDDCWVDDFLGDSSRYQNIAGGVDESTDVLSDLLVSEIIPVAIRSTQRDPVSFTEFKPFVGLVKETPKLALDVLLNAIGKYDVPVFFWESLLLSWPRKATSKYGSRVILQISILDKKEIYELRFEIIEWISINYKSLNLAYKNIHILDLISIVIKSFDFYDALNPTYSKGVEGIGASVNSARGRLAGVLIQLGCGGDDDLYAKNLLDELVDSPNDTEGLAIGVLAKKSDLFQEIDNVWFKKTILPCFNLSNSASHNAWLGLFSIREWWKVKSFWSDIKESFLALPTHIVSWREKREYATMYRWLVDAFFSHKKTNCGLTKDEVRSFIRDLSHKQKSELIQQLSKYKQNSEWGDNVLVFVNLCWPKEEAFKSQETSKAWFALLSNSGKDFSMIYPAIKNQLIPISSGNLHLFNFYCDRKNEPSLAYKFTDETLDLLGRVIFKVDISWVTELQQVLDALKVSRPGIKGEAKFQEFQALLAGGK
jgi:hypothetical protein